MNEASPDHSEHWMEPSAITADRPETDIYCEFCGEEVPWHKASCSMLKNAYKRRFSKCQFCDEIRLVGEEMAKHVQTTHIDELAAFVGKKK